MLVTDLDGTLLDRSGRIHAADAEAVRALLDRGVRVSFATGRMYSGSRDLALELALAGPLGCIDGSHVVDVSTERQLFCHGIPRAPLCELLGLLEQRSAAAFVFGDDEIFHDPRGARFLPYISVWSRRTRCTADVFGSDCLTQIDSVTAVVALGEERALREAAALLHAPAKALTVVTFPVAHPAFRGMAGMIVRAHGADKASALLRIAAYHGVSLAEAVVVGDWINDIPMLRAAGRSFAMAQAPREVKEAATDQLRASSETGGGILEAAERCGLL